jgi:hypothetical protein
MATAGLRGFVTEQDIVREVVAKGLDAATVKIAALVNGTGIFSPLPTSLSMPST